MDDGVLTRGHKLARKRQGKGEKGDARRKGMPVMGSHKQAPHKRTDKGPKKVKKASMKAAPRR